MSGPSAVVVVVGPTAAGKSELAVEVAEWFGGEVISADAFQIYRGLDVGTAKIDAAAARSIAHHCIDIAEPDEHYTAGRYAREAAAVIAEVQSRHRLAVVAGGSGLYVRALVDGLARLPEQDQRWRRVLESLERRHGSGRLFSMMQALDPEWAQAVGPADRQRLLRGLEVTLRLGMPMSVALERHGWSGPRFNAVWVGLTRPRAQLYERIEARVDEMLAADWLGEVRGLLRRRFGADAPGLRAIGYRELVAHLSGEMTLEEAREAIIRSTRRYAKRQLTWFRRQSPAVFFEVDDAGGKTGERIYSEIRGHLEEKLACYRWNQEHEPG